MDTLEKKIEEDKDSTGLEDTMIAFARRIKSFNMSNFNILKLTNNISQTIVDFVAILNDE